MRSPIDKMQEEGLITVIPAADSNRPDVPASLEESFMVHGPSLFLWLIDQAGGRVASERLSGVSPSTMSRWMNMEPGSLFGQGGSMRLYRSIWFGYPSPLPGFDRIVEEVYDPDKSFVGLCVERYGLKRTLQWMRGGRGYGLEMLDIDPDELRRAANSIGIPAATRRRWQTGLSYPTQWVSLDRLAMAVVKMSWLETVLRIRPRPVPRTVSIEALRCLVEDASHVG